MHGLCFHYAGIDLSPGDTSGKNSVTLDERCTVRVSIERERPFFL